MTTTAEISSAYPFTDQYCDTLDSRMHYVETGEGDPMVFLHGVPTWSYVWRNILPELKDSARCIAPDLIGMGRSDKPDIEYTIVDHCKYFDAFIEKMQLKNITLVLHGWGSLVGFDYARRHPDNVKSLVFYESHIRANVDWDMLSLPVQQLSSLLQRPKAAYSAIVGHNYLVNKLLPTGVVRPLTTEEMHFYQEPFPDEASRKPLWQYVNDLPLGEQSSDVIALIDDYSKWLVETDKPKLMMFAVPGFITTISCVAWAKENLQNLTLVELDDALHLAQESMPKEFSSILKDWHKNLA